MAISNGGECEAEGGLSQAGLLRISGQSPEVAARKAMCETLTREFVNWGVAK